MYKSRRRRISRRSSYDVLRVARLYLSAIDSPIALGVYLRLKYNEDTTRLTIDPIDYANPDSFHKDYLAVKFLSKFDGFGSPNEKRRVALESFFAFEQQCADTNRRLIKAPYPPGAVGDVLISASGKIRALLGDVDSSLEEILDSCRWGPGVTSSCKGKFLSAYNKFNSDIECTPAIVPFWESLVREFPTWLSGRAISAVVPGNKVTTVPKNSKTDRTIAVEPHLNAFLQRGVGRVLGRRLRRWGVTLHDQSRNRELAQIGSLSGGFATIDLKGASDTISTEVCRILLPPDWHHLLMLLRSDSYSLDGQQKRYHKMSSMGNGFTFELESLIFSSLVKAVYQHLGISDEFRVYGDDLVVATPAFLLLKDCLAYAGFSVNEDKTHSASPFRESCGGDYFLGVEVSPFFLREEGDIIQLITFANWLRVGSPSWLPIAEVWRYLYHAVPKQWANKGPSGAADSIFWVNYEEWDPDFVLHRRPYGPFMGYRILVPDFEPTSSGIPDGIPAVTAHLYLYPPVGSFFQRLVEDNFPSYKRRSVAREMGRWVLRSRVFSDSWPTVRWF